MIWLLDIDRLQAMVGIAAVGHEHDILALLL